MRDPGFHGAPVFNQPIKVASRIPGVASRSETCRHAGCEGMSCSLLRATEARDGTLDLAFDRKLRIALRLGEFELYWQPQVDIESGLPVGVEALIRWRHPMQGLVGPGAFIDHAEASGFIVDIGRWTMLTAAVQAAQWAAAGIFPTIAINMSPRQLECPCLADDMLEFLAPVISAGRLIVELTEALDITDNEAATCVLSKLRAASIQIHLDDFGAGHSTLARLHALPIDVAKMDRSLVVEAAQSEMAALTLSLAVKHAKSRGIGAVAEGIETPEQEAVVLAAGIQIAQGYRYAKPMPAAELLAWWKQRVPGTLPATCLRAHA